MSAKIIDGKAIAALVNQETAQEVAELTRAGLQPTLAVVLVGEDPASKVYVRNKSRTCQELGMISREIRLPENTTQEELLAVVQELNNDKAVNGILVQFPLPRHLDQEAVIAAIRPDKDVDCFHAANVGKLLIGAEDGFAPCTPKGVMVLLEKSNVDPAGKFVVVIGRSNIVGKPLMALMVQKSKGANATVCCVHSATPDIAQYTRQADIVIAAIGKPEFVRGDMLKPGAVVIDVGINRIDDPSAPKGSRLVGDVNFAEAVEVASQITPVPGGVGPMTIAMLMQNTVKAVKIQSAK